MRFTFLAILIAVSAHAQAPGQLTGLPPGQQPGQPILNNRSDVCYTVEQVVPTNEQAMDALLQQNLLQAQAQQGSVNQCTLAAQQGVLANVADTVGGGILDLGRAITSNNPASGIIASLSGSGDLAGEFGLGGGSCNLGVATVDTVACKALNANPDLMAELVAQNEVAEEGLKCQQRAIRSLEADLNCLGSRANELRQYATQAASAMQNAYQEALNQMEFLNRDAANCQAQKALIDQEAANFAQLQEGVEGLVDQLPALIDGPSGTEFQLSSAEKSQQFIDEAKLLRAGSLAKACMEQKTSEYQCQDPTTRQPINVNLEDYIKCLTVRNMTTQTNSQGQRQVTRNRSRGRAINAANEANNLGSLFQELILDEMPSDTDLNFLTQGPGQQVNTSQPLGDGSFEIMTIQDLIGNGRDGKPGEAQRLLSDPRWNTQSDIWGIIKTRAKNCFNRANRVVNREVSQSGNRNAGSALGRLIFQVERQRDNAYAAADQLIKQLNRNYLNMKTAMTELDVPFASLEDIGITGGDLGRCYEDYDSRRQCIRNFANGVEGLLNGTIPKSGGQLEFKGPLKPRFMNCRGVRGCAEALRQESEKVNSEIGRNQLQMQDHMRKFNVVMNNFGQRMSVGFGRIQQALQADLDALNRILNSKLGLPGIDVPDLAGQPLSTDAQGFFTPPNDPMRYIATKQQTKDISSSTLQAGMSEIQNKAGDIEQELQEVSTAKRDLQAAAAECAEDNLDEILDGITKQIEDYNEKNCAANFDSNSDPPLDPVEELMNEINSLGISDEYVTIVRSRLGTGIETVNIRDSLGGLERERDKLSCNNQYCTIFAGCIQFVKEDDREGKLQECASRAQSAVDSDGSCNGVQVDTSPANSTNECTSRYSSKLDRLEDSIGKIESTASSCTSISTRIVNSAGQIERATSSAETVIDAGTGGLDSDSLFDF